MRMCMYLSMYVQVYYMVLTYVSMHVGPCVHDKDTYVIYLWACVFQDELSFLHFQNIPMGFCGSICVCKLTQTDLQRWREGGACTYV